MRFELTRGAVAAVLSLLVGVGPTLRPSAALAQTPTAEQLKALQGLPQAQRDAILNQLGGAPSPTPGAAAMSNLNDIIVERPSVGSTGTASADATRRISGYEQLIVDLTLPSGDRPDMSNLIERRGQVLQHNPYELAHDGALQLPGLEPIPLAGLTEKEVQQRLASDPMLRDFGILVTVLHSDARGTRALKPFGYEMFLGGATAFVPGTDIPAPADYKLGPGDVVGVQLYGQESRTYSLPVGRDGTISFPELGPITVGGLAYGAAQSMLEQDVRQHIIGTRARVTLSELRSLRVLVLGDAQKPGSYVISSLSTVTNALFSSGGVKPIGSLRNIEVKREGKLIRHLDLYDVLLKGDTSNDVRLQTGDVVFVPPVGTTVGIDGEVRRPAIYEFTRERTLGELVAIAGGLNPEADSSTVNIERIGANGERAAVTLDLSTLAGQAFILKTGDVARVASVRPLIDNGIGLNGDVYRPGVYAWREGLRLSDVVRSVDDLKPSADLHYVLVRREAPGTRHITAFSADLAAAFVARGSAADIPLSARDRITVFDNTSPRERVVRALLDEVRRQSRPEDPAGVVTVEGLVNAPGTYPLEPEMRVSDLLRAGGGLRDAAYVVSAELVRYSVVDGERRKSEILWVDLMALRSGDKAADSRLRPYDVLSVRTTPEWGRDEKMELVGEVRFPGIYPLRRGETLRSVIERAGGLTPLASPEAAVFTREELKAREREQIDRLATRLESDLTAVSLQASRAAVQTNQASGQALAAGQGLLDQLRRTKPVGRMVIDLVAVVSPQRTADSDVEARNGDRLLVPRAVQEVSTVGEVQNPTSHFYHRGMTRDDVIALSGGLTQHADRKREYVVRADGSVVSPKSGWSRFGNSKLRPGDTVVVPIDTERMPPLPMWTAITTIIYNIAIAAAAVHSF
jgi:polysaccharide export outer membrane protein